MPHIDYYFTPTSPNVYNAGLRLEEIAKKHSATITYKPVDLPSIFAQTGGTPLPQRHENRKSYRVQELARCARLAGHPLNIHPAYFPANAAPSSYAIIAAQNAGGGDLGALCYGLCRAVWSEDKNIAEDDVIKAALTQAGFDPGLTDSGLLTGAETYTRFTDEAVAAGVFGAPFYITDGGEKFWGQDKLISLDMHLSGEL